MHDLLMHVRYCAQRLLQSQKPPSEHVKEVPPARQGNAPCVALCICPLTCLNMTSVSATAICSPVQCVLLCVTVCYCVSHLSRGSIHVDFFL